MSEPYEIKKAKINSLVTSFCSSGYKLNSKIGQPDLLQFLIKRTSSGFLDPGLSDKLFEVLNFDENSMISIEDFINVFLLFDEDLVKNAESLKLRLNQEQQLYQNLVEQCKLYKTEKLNEEGLCENAKVSGEITDVDIQKKLEGIKEIIIKVIYNNESEELHFKIGDNQGINMIKKGFEFKPTSRKDHFEFIMQGVNEKNQVFDIGSKVFPFTDINSHEEYIVQIIVPEIDNDEEVAAFIKAKIILYWSDYKYYERLRKKAERKIKKISAAMNKANQYLNYIKEIYGDLSIQQSELIVDFNNAKLMQRKGTNFRVDFNNSKEAEAQGGDFMVEFNNQKEIERKVETVQVEFNNEKEVAVENNVIEEEHIQEENVNTQEIQENIPPVEQIVQEPEHIILKEKHEMRVSTQINDPIYNEPLHVPAVQKEVITRKELVSPTKEINGGLSLATREEAEIYKSMVAAGTTNEVINDYPQGQLSQGQAMAETIGYGTSDTMGNVEAYGTGGLEVIDQTSPDQFPSVEDLVKDTEVRTSVNKTLVNETIKNVSMTTKTLPVKVMETKIHESIYDNNVNTLPVIFGGKRVSYASREESAEYINNNINNLGNYQNIENQGDENNYFTQ